MFITIVKVIISIIIIATALGISVNITQSEMKTKKKAVSCAGIALALIILFGASSCIKIVETGKIAVVTRFGNVIGMETSGLHIKAPWNKYNIIDVTQNQITDNYSTATKDNQSVNQEITSQIIVNPKHAKSLYESFLGNHMNGIVAPTLHDGFKAATAKFTLEETISQRDQLSEAMLKSIQDKLASYGIQVVSVEIKNVELPEEYKAAVERQKVAERDKVTAQVKLEQASIEAETNKVLSQSMDENILAKMFYEKWNGKLPQYMGGGETSLLLPELQ